MAVCVFSRTATTCVFLLTLLGAAACNEESGVRVSSMTVQRHQGRQAVAAQIGAGDRRQLEVAVGREALLQSRAVRGGPEADRGVLPRPRLSRCAHLVVRREAEPGSELGGDRAQRLRRRADHRRARRFRGLRAVAGRPLQGPDGAAAAEAGAAARSCADPGHARSGARRAERPRVSVRNGTARRRTGHGGAQAGVEAHRRTGRHRLSRSARDSGQLERRRSDHPPAADVPPRRPVPPEQAAREPAPALLARGLPVRQRPVGS